MSRIARRYGWLIVSLTFSVAIACSAPGAEPQSGRVGQAERSPTNDQPPGKTPAPAQKAPGGIIISRETTYLTGPLRADGSVDYLAALNERYAKGVTPENNAMIPLLQAIGPKGISEKTRERFFKTLGIAPLPEKEAYLEEFTDYFERKTSPAAAPGDEPSPDVSENAYKESLRIMDRPWSKKDSPIGAAWLEENQKQTDLIVAATKRPRFYAPLVTNRDEPGEILVASLPFVQQSRLAFRVLCARAMLHVGEGKPEEAWQDLLACHRLARLVDQGPTLVDGLVAIALDGMALAGAGVLAHEGKLTAAQAQQFAADFRRLPPLTKMADRINSTERLIYLDYVLWASRKGVKGLILWSDPFTDTNKVFASVAQWLATVLVDWNEPMRMGNRWCDRLVAALSKPTGKERNAAMVEFDRDLEKAAAEVTSPRAWLRNIAVAGSLRGGLGRQVGNAAIDLFMSSLCACVNAEDRITTQQSMVPVLFALTAYRADHGAYPPELTALAPKYLPAIPEDLFSDKPLRYKRADAGYVVYSVGPNGKDNGGVAAWDEDHGPNDDDIPIRVPAKSK